jgi:hypothetical protein
MSTNFPTSLDSFTNPGPTDAMNASPALDHDVQHGNENDAITALETKVGIDGSAVAGSLDYKSKKGSFIRATTAVTSSSLATGAADATQTAPLGKGTIALVIQTDHPAWVRIYASAAAQSADSARLVTIDPTAGSGVLLDVLTSGSALTIVLSPPLILFSSDGSSPVSLPITIVNEDTSTETITVTLTTVPFEG